MNWRTGMILVVAVGLLAGCSSTGTLGIVTKSSAQNAEILKAGKPFDELGQAEGESCRHFLLAIIPWGSGTLPDAVDESLKDKAGDALVNVTVTTSLYGFVPIYNVYTYTCTKVQGIAVKFKP